MRFKNPALLAVTLSLFGCQTMDPAAGPDAPGSSPVVSEKPSIAYWRAPKALREAGVSGASLGASFDEDGEGITVRTSIPDGRKFAINFRQAGPNATRIGIVWDGQPDDALERKLMAALTRK